MVMVTPADESVTRGRRPTRRQRPGSTRSQAIGPTVGDLNDDGLPDILLNRTFVASARVYVNNGAGGFSEIDANTFPKDDGTAAHTRTPTSTSTRCSALPGGAGTPNPTDILYRNQGQRLGDRPSPRRHRRLHRHERGSDAEGPGAADHLPAAGPLICRPGRTRDG